MKNILTYVATGIRDSVNAVGLQLLAIYYGMRPYATQFESLFTIAIFK